jgi:hypothetical protein
MIGKLGGRKFIVVMVALGCGFTLAMLGKLTADFALICSICVGAFMAAHGVADYKNGSILRRTLDRVP